MDHPRELRQGAFARWVVATELDKAGDHLSAISEYREGLDLMMLAIQFEAAPTLRSTMQGRAGLFLARLEHLSEYAANRPGAVEVMSEALRVAAHGESYEENEVSLHTTAPDEQTAGPGGGDRKEACAGDGGGNGGKEEAEAAEEEEEDDDDELLLNESEREGVRAANRELEEVQEFLADDGHETRLRHQKVRAEWQKTRKGPPLVFSAAQEGDAARLQELLADPEQSPDEMGSWDHQRRAWDEGRGIWRVRNEAAPTWSALQVAARLGRSDCVGVLLGSRAELETRDRDGYTALRFAAQWGHAEAVELLCRAGAEPNTQDEWGETALMWACCGGYDFSVQQRVDAGEELFWDKSEYPRCVAALLGAGASVQLRCERGQSALMLAASKGMLSTMRLLTQHPECDSAMLDFTDQDDGWTALLFSIDQEVNLLDEGHDWSCAEHLLECGASCDQDVLDYARKAKQWDMVELILHQGGSSLHPPSGFESDTDRAKAIKHAADGYWCTMLMVGTEEAGWLPSLQAAFVEAETGAPTTLAVWAALVNHPALAKFFALVATDSEGGGELPAVFFSATYSKCSSSDGQGWTIGHFLVESGSLHTLQLAIRAGLCVDTARSTLRISVREQAKFHPRLRSWALRHGAYGGRWRLQPGRPKYESATSTVYEAVDVEMEAASAEAEARIATTAEQIQLDPASAELQKRLDALACAGTPPEGVPPKSANLGNGPTTREATQPLQTSLSLNVCVKVMRREEDWLRECEARRQLAQKQQQGEGNEDTSGTSAAPPFVVPILVAQRITSQDRRQRLSTRIHQQHEPAPESRSLHEENARDCGEWMLAMPLGDRSLDEIIYKERVAGLSLGFVVGAARDLAQCLHELHARSLVHGDVKPRNVCRFGTRFQLIDLDAAARFGEPVGRKAIPGFCSAYAPPELGACLLLGGDCTSNSDSTAASKATLPAAGSAFDVWSFGAVLFELATGVSLFHCDCAADHVVGDYAKVELLNWSGLDARRLGLIFADGASHGRPGTQQLHSTARADAQNLIARCLQPDPKARLTMQQILRHRFLDRSAPDEPEPVASTHHFFLSHFQKEGADLVRSVYLMLRDSGCSCWLDMEAADLTLAGMQSGVRDSDCFVLVLTCGVLFRPYCVEEIAVAHELGKPVVLLVEEDPKYFRFDYDHWRKRWHAGDDDYDWCLSELAVMAGGNTRGALEKLERVAALVEAHKSAMIPYRRRNFESTAMVTEILRRNQLHTIETVRPQQVDETAALLRRANSTPAHAVTILHHEKTGAEVAHWMAVSLGARGVSVEKGLDGDCPRVRDSNDSAVLLVLTDGTLTDRAITDQLVAVLASRTVSLEVVQHHWSFGSAEQAQAQREPAIARMFAQKEFLAFRSPTREGAAEDTGGHSYMYEHDAMCDELLRRYTAASARR